METAVFNGKSNFKELDGIKTKLDDSKSDYTDLILELIQNKRKIGLSVSTDEEDILITSFVEPLIMPFLRGIPHTTTYGNSHTLEESCTRKRSMAEKYKLSSKYVRG